MALLKVALLQMAGCGTNAAEALEKGETFCRLAQGLGADIALFPELWNVGYALPDPADKTDTAAWKERAIEPKGPWLRHFAELARELEMAIAVTYLERWPGRPRNTVSIIDRAGEIALTYAKVHTCEFDRETVFTPGRGFPVATLDTAAGPVRVGCMICYDREFPETARILMLGGAEIVLVPNACEMEPNRLAQLRTRAFENMMGVAMANYAGTGECNGQSIAFDGIAFDELDGGSREMTLVHADGDEGVFVAGFDLDAMRAYRSREVWGNAYRRPRLYGALVEESVSPPFIRPDATR
jgi:predicted amidohydrolase